LAVGFYNPGEDGILQRVWRTELDIDGELSEVSEALGQVRPELILINDDDLAYAKIRLDEHSRAAAIRGLSRIASPLARALIWGSLWDSTRDAETPPQEFIELVLGNIASESESTTIRTALGQLSLVARNYVTPERRSEVLEHVATRLWDLASSAATGSDSQFQLVKAYAMLASTTEHADILRSLLEGRISLAGLVIDTDLSWELLAGLALVGAADKAEIEAALAKDNTSNGQQAAARARSLIPTTENKRAVFTELVTSPDTPNAIVRSLTLGYDLAHDPSALEPLVDDYFSMLENMWNERTYKIAEYLAEGLYPSSLVSEDLVRKSRQWLESHPSIPALRRIVEENLAGVERSLRVRDVDRLHTGS
jgi:aminopeptidase N